VIDPKLARDQDRRRQRRDLGERPPARDERHRHSERQRPDL
jgi:hypothetical protein